MKKYVGSYERVVDTIIEKIRDAECQTLQGNNLCKEMYKNLNESITPMLKLRTFMTGAEKLSKNDITIKEIFDFVTKQVDKNSYDLNFIINLCKEEHFEHLIRTNHPSPRATVNTIKKYFDEPDNNLIKNAIKEGILDSLRSDLLVTVKKDLGIIPSILSGNLNESQQVIAGNLSMYSPIGVKFEDIKNNRAIYMSEYDMYLYNRTTKDFSAINLDDIDIEIPDEYKKLMYAINSLVYNPLDNTFSPSLDWDFELKLTIDGDLTINGKPIIKEDLVSLFMESIDVYISDPVKYPNFNKQMFLEDADNFIIVLENYPKLIRFDNLKTIRNLNESTYITINSKSLVDPKISPKIISSSLVKNKQFESYGDMLNECNSLLNNDITKLFESQLKNEQQLMLKKNENIVSLVENQKEINSGLTKINNLKGLADENSPAMDKLNEQETILKTQLSDNLEKLNFYRNEFKLY